MSKSRVAISVRTIKYRIAVVWRILTAEIDSVPDTLPRQDTQKDGGTERTDLGPTIKREPSDNRRQRQQKQWPTCVRSVKWSGVSGVDARSFA